MSALCACAALLSSEFVLSALQPAFARSAFVSLTTWLANDVEADDGVVAFFLSLVGVLVAFGLDFCASTRAVRDGAAVFFDFGALVVVGSGSPVGSAVSCGSGPVSATVFEGASLSPSSDR